MKAILHTIVVIFILGITFCQAQKTDILILKNGDHITGEVKRLDLDILQFKTSTMSTAKVKWFQVSNIYAPDKYFQIDLIDKTRIYGSLDSAKSPNTLEIKGEMGVFTVYTENVVTIIQMKQAIWSRFSGDLSAGLSYTKASDAVQANGSGTISYTEDKYNGKIEFSSIQSIQFDSIFNLKQDAGINVNRMISSTQFVTLFGTSQRNTELGIQLRSSAGGGYGYDLIHSNIARVRSIVGMSFNREKGLGESPSTYNGEGLIRAEAMIFKYSDPELHLNTHVNWYPSLTVPGRHRLEIEFKIRMEVVNNFFIELRYYNNFDSKPVQSSTSNSDYGIISSLSYTFGL